MKSKFEKSMEFVLRWEGGYVDNPNDPGGATNRGITLNTAKEFGVDVNLDGKTDKEDMKNLPLDTALQIYKARYWNAMDCDSYDFPCALTLMDAAVNCGVSKAKQWAAIAKGDYKKVNELRIAFYIELSKQPRFKEFLRGWINRVNDLKKFIDTVE